MAVLTEELVAELITKHRGNCAAIGRACEVTRGAVVNYIRRHPPLGELLTQAREALVDDAEDALSAAVGRGESWAVCFTLKCLGKCRGYVEPQELTGRDSGPLNAPPPLPSIEDFSKLSLDERIRLLRERTGQAAKN